jgi:hypothetical protein
MVGVARRSSLAQLTFEAEAGNCEECGDTRKHAAIAASIICPR